MSIRRSPQMTRRGAGVSGGFDAALSQKLDAVIIALDEHPHGVRGWWLRLYKRIIERRIPRPEQPSADRLARTCPHTRHAARVCSTVQLGWPLYEISEDLDCGCACHQRAV